jgi:Arc/MetJ-type ribon-helix-helix transcriptional regulator
MQHQFPADVEQLITERMATGQYASEADLVRQALLSLSTEDQDLEAVREAIADLENGDLGIPLDEAFDRIRHSRSNSQEG